MATKIVQWKSIDGSTHDTREEAEVHDLVIEVNTYLTKQALSYDYDIDNFEIDKFADLIVNTDTLVGLTQLLKDKL